MAENYLTSENYLRSEPKFNSQDRLVVVRINGVEVPLDFHPDPQAPAISKKQADGYETQLYVNDLGLYVAKKVGATQGSIDFDFIIQLTDKLGRASVWVENVGEAVADYNNIVGKLEHLKVLQSENPTIESHRALQFALGIVDERLDCGEHLSRSDYDKIRERFILSRDALASVATESYNPADIITILDQQDLVILIIWETRKAVIHLTTSS